MFGRVGLADDDRACRAEVLGEHAVALGDGLMHDRAMGGRQATYIHQILDRDRQAVERAERISARDGGIRLCGKRQRFAARHHAQEGVVMAVELLDPVEEGTHHLDRRQPPCPYVGGQIAGVAPVQCVFGADHAASCGTM